jgi:hypothetical protein
MSDDEKPPIAEVIDLAARRHERATLAGRSEAVLVNPNSLKIALGDDGGFSIVAELIRPAGETIEWEVKAPFAQKLARNLTHIYSRAQWEAYYKAHPEQAPKPYRSPAYRRCGLTRAGKLGRSRDTSCSRRCGHKGDHKDATGAWSMPCPCPGSDTTVYMPGGGGMRIGYATCAWCGLRRDEQGRPMPTEVKP